MSCPDSAIIDASGLLNTCVTWTNLVTLRERYNTAAQAVNDCGEIGLELYGASPNLEDISALPTLQGFFRIKTDVDTDTGQSSINKTEFVVASGDFLALAGNSNYSYFKSTATRQWCISTNDDCHACGILTPSHPGFTEAYVNLTCHGSMTTLYPGYYKASFQSSADVCNIKFDWVDDGTAKFEAVLPYFPATLISSSSGDCTKTVNICCSDFYAVGHYEDYGNDGHGNYYLKLAYIDYGVDSGGSAAIDGLVTTGIMADDILGFRTKLSDLGNQYIFPGACPWCNDCHVGGSQDKCPPGKVGFAAGASVGMPAAQLLQVAGTCQGCADTGEDVAVAGMICACHWVELGAALAFITSQCLCPEGVDPKVGCDGYPCVTDAEQEDAATPCPEPGTCTSVGDGSCQTYGCGDTCGCCTYFMCMGGSQTCPDGTVCSCGVCIDNGDGTFGCTYVGGYYYCDNCTS